MGRGYIPLDNILRYREGLLRLTGWWLVPLLALVTGALLTAYELRLTPVGDRDMRDMHLDYRLTLYGRK